MVLDFRLSLDCLFPCRTLDCEPSLRCNLALAASLLMLVCGCANFVSTVAPDQTAPVAFDEAVEFSSSDVKRLREVTGDQLSAAGHHDDAMRMYLWAGEEGGYSEALRHKTARSAAEADESDVAIQQFEAAINQSPDNSELLNDYGVLLHRQGDYAKAEAVLLRARMVDASNARVVMNLAATVAQQGRESEAINLYKSVVGPAVANYNLGVMLVEKGRFDTAHKYFSMALKLDPKLAAAEQFIKSLDRAEKAAADAPNGIARSRQAN